MAQLKPWKELLVVFLLSSVLGLISLLLIIVRLIRKGPSSLFFVKKRNVRPEVLENNKFGSHEFVRLKNARMKLHCVVSGPKDKPLMLFVHGFPEFWYSWRYQLKEFSKNYRTVAIDMRGYGESDKPRDIASYTMDRLVNDIDELIPALGYKSCILVGHDWGGAVAWSFASLHPEKVDRLINCNIPHPDAFLKYIYTARTQLLKSWYIFYFQIPFLPLFDLRSNDIRKICSAFCERPMGAKPGTFTDEDIEAYKYTFAEYDDMLGPINYYRAIMRYESQSLSKIKVVAPTLLIWGTNDGALEKKMAELSGDYVENFTLRYIEGASHWVQQEEPERVNTLIQEFLNN